MDKPNVKVTVGAFAGWIVSMVIWTLSTYTSAIVPAEIAVQGTAALTFVLQYFVSEPS